MFKNFIVKIDSVIHKSIFEILIFNKGLRSVLKAKWTKSILKKYIQKSIKNINTIQENCGYDNVIWQYWHQGIENAPTIVKECLKSVEKHESDKKIIVLSFDTIKKYIELPQRYYDLVNSGKMSVAHFSDILRIYLLNQYGGIWIDSTIYLTDKIPNDIIDANFCVLQKEPKDYNQCNTMSCFFIRAKKGSAHIQAMKTVLDYYWQIHDFAINYFMFEHISTILSNFNNILKEEWDKMPYYEAENTAILQKNLHKKFDTQVFENIKKETSIHKLSYKMASKYTTENSFYDYLISKQEQKHVTIVIPTLQKKVDILDKLIESLNADDAVSEIILVDNSLKGYNKNYPKLKVIIPSENMFVNPSWNLGVKNAENEIVGLLNDDIIIPKDFCKNIINQMTPNMGIVGFNSGNFVKPIEDKIIEPQTESLYLEKTKFMDLCFGIAMFFYKSSYYEIPDEIKITYGDVWIYHKNLRNGRKNYRISGQHIYHWGSLSSSSKALSHICRNDAKLYKQLMIRVRDRLFSYDNVWDCFKIRILGLTLKIPKFKKNRL